MSNLAQNEPLSGIENWRERAVTAGWCVVTLAKNSGVSVSTLERHFKAVFGKCPHAWMDEEFMRPAREFLAKGLSVKETASELKYNHQHHFSAAFKRLYGYPPSQHKRRAESG